MCFGIYVTPYRIYTGNRALGLGHGLMRAYGFFTLDDISFKFTFSKYKA